MIRAHRLLTVSAALAVLVASLLLAAPAGSATPPWRAVLTFDKNWQNQFDSRVVWQLYQRQADGAWKVVETRSWRAGSGLPGPVGRNSCKTSKGWFSSWFDTVKKEIGM